MFLKIIIIKWGFLETTTYAWNQASLAEMKKNKNNNTQFLFSGLSYPGVSQSANNFSPLYAELYLKYKTQI